MVKTFRLSNGVTCVCEERPKSGKVSMQIHIKSGSVNESAEENGLTFLMQASCLGGTTTRSREQIAEGVESKGGELGSSTDRTTTTFQAQALARHAKETFTILADMVRHPAFDAAEIQKTKTQIEQEIIQQDESPATKARIKFYKGAFSGQSAGRDPLGTQELLDSFTPAQVRQKHADVLAHPENIVISFAGDISLSQVKKLVRNYFGDLPSAAAAAKTPQMQFTGGDLREATDNEQISLLLGFQAPPKNDPDRYATMMLNEFLGGGMSSPLFQEIREKRGLVYTVSAGYTPYETSGIFRISAGAGKGNAGELISVALDLLGKTVREGLDQEALDQARERIIRKIIESCEMAGGTGARNADQLMFFGRLIPPEEYEERLKQVTSDDIRRVCAGLMRSGKYALAGVGPQDTMPTADEIKDMISDQLQGVTVPSSPRPVQETIKPPFMAAAKKRAAAAVEPKMTTLKNGMKVVTVERPGNLSCGAWVGAGSDHETPALNGATHMNEHMMFKGTPSYAPGQIDKIVEGQLGAELNAYTSNDKTAYYFYNLKADALEKIVDICGEMVFKANLDHAEFDGKSVIMPSGSTYKMKGERDVVVEELNRANDTIEGHAWNLLMETAYPNQPHGRPILGTEATLRAMTVQQLAAYRDEYYAPNNVVFCAAGPVRHEDFVALVEKQYGRMPAKEFPPLPVPVYHGGTAFAEYKNASLCDVTLLAESVPGSDPDCLAYEVLGAILGGGMSSRLYKEIVIKQELSADVTAESQDFRNCGMFYVGASLAPEKIRPFINAAYAEMRALVSNLAEEDLGKVKNMMEMALLNGMETNRDVCDRFANNTLDEGRLLTQAEIASRIKKLTVDDIKRVAKKVLASTPTLGMIVPPGTDQKYLPKQEEVVAMRDGKAPEKDSPRPKSPDANP